MVLVNLTTLEESAVQQFSGFIIQENVREGTNLEIPAAITADLETLTVNFVAGAYWSAALKVTDFSPNFVRGFRGDPPRFGFGSLVHLCRDTVTSFHYINYQKQSFPRQSCMAFPDIYFAYPYSTAEIPEFQNHDLLIPIVANQYQPGVNTGRSQDTYRENSGLFGATDIRITLEESVEITLCISYFGHFYNTNSDTLDVSYFNM